MAELIPDGATLQLGIGAIPSATALALMRPRDLGIHTEMFTDAVVDLVEAGVVTGARKQRNRGKIVTAFMMGTRRLYDFVNDNPMVEMRSVDFTNDTHVIRSFNTMTAINSAIEVDLTGQVVADSIGSRIYSGVGGQMDFVRGAALAAEGRAIIALPSTAANGAISRISADARLRGRRRHHPCPRPDDRDRVRRRRAVRAEPPRAGRGAHRDRPSRPSRAAAVGGAPDSASPDAGPADPPASPGDRGSARAVELPDPRPGPASCCFASSACAVCRTDLQIATGDLPPHRTPSCPATRPSATVAAVGRGCRGLGRR